MLEETVKEILRYVRVDKKTRDSIRDRLIPFLRRQDIDNFDEIYERVTDWIDERIDHSYSNGYRRQFQDPKAKTPLEILESRDKSLFSLDEVIEILRKRLDVNRFCTAKLILEKNREKFEELRYDPKIIERLLPEIENSVQELYNLISEGASNNNLARIFDLGRETVRRLRRNISSSFTQKSEIFSRISVFSERRLLEAAEMNMSVMEASKYAGLNQRAARILGRKIGHSYITPEQQERILQGIDVGANKYQIVKYAGITDSDLEFFMNLKELRLKNYNPNNSIRSIPRYEVLSKAG